MTLLGPAMLVGLLGLALPVLAHLLGREKPTEIPFAAMRFLPQVDPAVTHRRSVRDWPLLLVRLLLLALLVFALARPSTQHDGGVTMIAEPHDAVVLIDASRSMGLRVDGTSMVERAAQQAQDLLASLPAGSRVGLLTTDPDGPRVELTADPSRAADALTAWLERSPPRPGAWPLASGVPSAAKMLLDSSDASRKRVVYAVGDATEGGLGGLPQAAEGGAVVIPVPALDPADDALPSHVALTDVSWEPAPDLDPRAARIDAIVRWVGAPTDASPIAVTVALYIKDDEVARAVAEVPPEADTPIQFTHTLLEDADILPATVAILDPADDALVSDDRRHMWLTAEDAMDVAVVNGDPSELRAHDEVFFLTTAVAADNDDQAMRVRGLAPDQLAQQVRKDGARSLDDVDVLVLANVRAPDPEVAAAIIERVRGGMGLLVAVGDRVDADAYNRVLRDVLPLAMRGPVQIGTAPGRTEARVEGVAPADLTHPIFNGLGGAVGLSGAKARRVMLLEPDPRGQARIALSFTSGAPALLTRTTGDGRVALLTTSIDRDWADLPLRPGFVPMVAGLLSYLGDGGRGHTGSTLSVGEARRVRTQAPAVFVTPLGTEVSVAPTEGVATFDDTYAAGHYRVRLDGAPPAVFAVQVDRSESETSPVEITSAEATADEEGRVAVNVPQWRWLVWLALGLLGLEAALRWRARTRAT